jgi:hypothetical protein
MIRRLTLAAGLLLLLAPLRPAPAAARWHDTYEEAHQLAVEFNRPIVLLFVSEKDQVREAQRLFNRPEVRRLQRLFVFAYEVVLVKDRTISSPLFHKYPPEGGKVRMPMFVIVFASPDEKVLYQMQGVPSTKDLRLGMGIALRKHGPVPDIADIRQAKRALERIDALIQEENYAPASRLCSRLAEKNITAKFTEETKKRLATLNEAASSRLADARRYLRAENYSLAVPALTAVRHDFPTLDAAREAAAELAKLQELPAAKAAFKSAAKAEAAPAAEGGASPNTVTIGALTIQVKRPAPEDAPDAFTDAELDALDKLGQPGAEPDAIRRSTSNPKAQRLLRFARNWMANDKPDKAVRLLAQILDLYPDSAEADQAKVLLEKLD